MYIAPVKLGILTYHVRTDLLLSRPQVEVALLPLELAAWQEIVYSSLYFTYRSFNKQAAGHSFLVIFLACRCLQGGTKTHSSRVFLLYTRDEVGYAPGNTPCKLR